MDRENTEFSLTQTDYNVYLNWGTVGNYETGCTQVDLPDLTHGK